MHRPTIRVLVAADREVAAARLEAMLRADTTRRVLIGTPGALGRLIEEHDPAVVVLASTAARAISILSTLVDTTLGAARGPDRRRSAGGMDSSGAPGRRARGPG